VRQNENANMTVLGIHEKVIEPEAKRKKAAPFHSLKKKLFPFSRCSSPRADALNRQFLL
jgi:hypothetical protein